MLASGPNGHQVGSCGHPPDGVRAMVEVAAEHGVPAETCLRGTGLSLEDTSVRAAQELLVAENVVGATGRPGLGLEVGRRFSLRSYGVWGFALLTCPTLRDAAEIGLRYLALTYATADIRVRLASREVQLVIDEPPVAAPVRSFLVEREVATVRSILHAILGEPPSVRIELRRPPPDVPVRYDAPVTFGAPCNAIIADAGLLDHPLPQADPLTMRVCERACRVLLGDRSATGVSAQVRSMLAADPLPDAPAVAARLHLSARTLRRHLAAEGTSYRQLVDDARHALAVELLTGRTVEQVALRLGYVDAATFIRAFRRWTGTTPGAYR